MSKEEKESPSVLESIEDSVSHLTSEAIKTYLGKMEENKKSAKMIAGGLSVVVYDSLVDFYGADVERRNKVVEEFIACASGPPRGIWEV